MNRTTNRFASLIIATLLGLGLLAAPAHAGGQEPSNCDRSTPCEPAPPVDCDETVQDLRNRLAIAENYRDRYLEKLILAQSNLSSAISLVRTERAITERLRDELATTTTRATDAELVAEQRRARVQRKVAIIRNLRDQLRKARR